MPTSTIDTTSAEEENSLPVSGSSFISELDEADIASEYSERTSISQSFSRQWHEAAFILNIKEKHLPQVAIDQVILATS